MSYSPAPLIQSITCVASHWRFTPAKLPLLCQRAKIILKQKYTFQLPQYCFTTLPYSSLYEKFSIHKLPKANESTNIILITSSNTTFLKQRSFSQTVLEASSVLELQSESPPHLPHFLSLSPHSHQFFTPNNQLFSLPSITLKPITLLAPS